MNNKQLKCFLKDKYDIKVKSIGFLELKFYTLSFHYDSQGGCYDYTCSFDEFGDVLYNQMFNSVADILLAMKNSKDYKGELELL